MTSATKKRVSNKTRPTELSEWVFFDQGQKINWMVGSTQEFSHKVKSNMRPMIYIHYLGGGRRYPYEVAIDLVEGFSTSCYQFTEEAANRVIDIFTNGRKYKSTCYFSREHFGRFYYARYATVQDAVEVANGLAALDSNCFQTMV